MHRGQVRVSSDDDIIGLGVGRLHSKKSQRQSCCQAHVADFPNYPGKQLSIEFRPNRGGGLS